MKIFFPNVCNHSEIMFTFAHVTINITYNIYFIRHNYGFERNKDREEPMDRICW